MKIGILGSRGIPNHYGGFEQFAEYLSLGLSEMGAEVWVYCSHNHPFNGKKWKSVNLIHCYDPEDKMGTAGQFIYDLNCILDSRHRNFDVLIQLGYTSSSVWHWLLPSSLVIITNMDGLEWKRSKYGIQVQKFLKYAEKLAVTHSDFLVADSEAIAGYLSEEYSRDAFFIPYGAEIFDKPDESALQPFGLEKFDYHLLIARMQPDNHVEEIIKGVIGSDCSKPLVVVGKTDNAHGSWLKKRYSSEKIQFTGGIYDLNVLNQLRYFSNFYFHGHSAGGTNPSLLEAMAASAVICAHENPFNKAVLAKDAFYFKDEKEITRLLNSTEGKPNHREFIDNNRLKIKTKYSWEGVINGYYDLFQLALSKKKRD